MLELIITTLPSRVPSFARPLFCIPQFGFYAIEKLTPIKCMKRMLRDGRILFKCFREGSMDEEAEELMQKLRRATCLADYEKFATRLDTIQGHEDWKEEPDSVEREYDIEAIQRHIDEMYEALGSHDMEKMRLSLRASASRTIGGMDLLRLYKHTWFDTKHKINEFNHTVRGTIEAYVTLLREPGTPSSEIEKGIAALEHYLKLHGSAALCLSGGALCGMKHIGVVKCLWESYFLPDIICGTSAGSIVASIVGCSTDDEMQNVLDKFGEEHLQCFDSSKNLSTYMYHRIVEFSSTGNLFDPSYLNNVMAGWIEDITFEEAFHKTGRVLNIAVSKMKDTRPTILNHVTAPKVVVRTAVCASCAVPCLFPAATILQKEDDSQELRPWPTDSRGEYVDGSLDGDIPTGLLKEKWNADFFIVSQVNPHVRWFLRREEEFAGRPVVTSEPKSIMWERVQVRSLDLVVKVLGLMGGGVSMLEGLPLVSGIQKWHYWRYRTILTQTYTGNVNIYPSIRWGELGKLMTNPTSEYITRSIKEGEQATWPKMPRIKNNLAIEEGLKKGIKALKQTLKHGTQPSEDHVHASIDRPARSSAMQPPFLRRRSLDTMRRPEVRRTGTDGEGSRAKEARPEEMRRNRSEPCLTTMLMTSTLPRPQALSPGPAVSRQMALGGSLSMTQIMAAPQRG